MTMPSGNLSSEYGASASRDLLRDPGLKPLRESVGQLVGTVFYGTLLRAVHSGDSAEGYGRGGAGEKMFQAQLDQILAEKAGASQRDNLTTALLKRLAPQQLRIQAARPAEAEVSGAQP